MNSCANKPLYQGSSEKVSPYMANIYDSATVGQQNTQVPFPRMGYELDGNVPIQPSPALSNNNLRLGEETQRMMGESRLNASRNTPMGMRLPMMATKGKMGSSPKQLFDSENESFYDSDGEYRSV